jgi:hypothetical protein
MLNNSPKTVGNNRTTIAPEAARANAAKSRQQALVDELLRECQGRLPVWIRSPKQGPEFYSGFTRSKLYEESAKGNIRSVSIREPGQVKGTRLFELNSILRFIEKCDAEAMERSAK